MIDIVKARYEMSELKIITQLSNIITRALLLIDTQNVSNVVKMILDNCVTNSSYI
jgi:hypothetical protein